MPIPWAQIARLVPLIVSLSQELLQQTKRTDRFTFGSVEARLAKLEQNEVQQAELVQKMAQQIAATTEATIALRRQIRLVLITALVAFLTALAAIVVAVR